MAIRVRSMYRNKDMEIVDQQDLTLEEWAALQKNRLMKLVAEAEDLAYRATDGKSKEEWPRDVMESFLRLRHRILDAAGEADRLPQNARTEDLLTIWTEHDKEGR